VGSIPILSTIYPQK